MTTEDDFHRQLDANPEDHHTRLVLADFLDEHGDPRAPGYRALGKLQKQPTPYAVRGASRHHIEHSLGQKFVPAFWTWWGSAEVGGLDDELPKDWLESIPSNPDATLVRRHGVHHEPVDGSPTHATRRESEDAAALAFGKLPPERQAELLGTHEGYQEPKPEQMSRLLYQRRQSVRRYAEKVTPLYVHSEGKLPNHSTVQKFIPRNRGGQRVWTATVPVQYPSYAIPKLKNAIHKDEADKLGVGHGLPIGPHNEHLTVPMAQEIPESTPASTGKYPSYQTTPTPPRIGTGLVPKKGKEILPKREPRPNPIEPEETEADRLPYKRLMSRLLAKKNRSKVCSSPTNKRKSTAPTGARM